MTLAKKYALVYLLAGSLWILLSDFLVFYGSDNHNASYLNWELFKGLLFVLLTSILVYYLLYQSMKQIAGDKRRIETRETILSRILNNSGNDFGLFDADGHLVFSTQGNSSLEKNIPARHFFESFHLASAHTKALEMLLYECNHEQEEIQRDLFVEATNEFLSFLFIPIYDHREIMVIVENQTGKKRQEKHQRINQKMMDLLFVSKEIGIWDWDVRLNTYHSNSNMQLIVGAESESEVPQNQEWIKRIHPDEKQAVLSAYTEHLQGDTESSECCYRFKTLTNKWKWVVEYSMVTERDENGEPLHMIGVLIDFDRFKKHELTIAMQGKLIDQVAFANSHEIRGPLARIKGLMLLVAEMRKSGEKLENSSLTEILDKLTVSAEELDEALNQTAEMLNKNEA